MNTQSDRLLLSRKLQTFERVAKKYEKEYDF